MCMEDVILGREKRTAAKPVALQNGVSTLIVPENASRVHLSFATAGLAARVCPDGGDDVGGGSYPISSTSMPVEIDITIHGDIVTKGWTGSGVAGIVEILVVETFLPRRS